MAQSSWEGIPYSKPYGFEPERTKEVINAYKESIDKMKVVITNLQSLLLQKDQEIKQMEGELRRMTLEMTMLDVPKMSDIVQGQILSEFKDAHLRGDIKECEVVSAQIPEEIENSTIDDGFDIFNDLSSISAPQPKLQIQSEQAGQQVQKVDIEQEIEEPVDIQEDKNVSNPKKKFSLNGIKIKNILKK